MWMNFGEGVQGQSENLWILHTKNYEKDGAISETADFVVKTAKEIKIVLAFFGYIRYAKDVILHLHDDLIVIVTTY